MFCFHLANGAIIMGSLTIFAFSTNKIKTLIINRFFDLIYVRGKNFQRT